ncbi:hypothetical protein MTR67_034458 [Solanum verrucosum]|uniref:Integrase zinc-binding domain-containing protein n=1 Tax=Solanum verrucosum TaxID=315347 RepID=A0AAF0ZKE8_SOLVR|nr:hypothetical protein MTR67_034458 [Solanum verrucosum]
MNVLYHSGKANVVAYALSRLSMGSVAHVEEERKELAKDVYRLARLGEVFWWNGMKKDITDFVAKCHNCQQVKEVFWWNGMKKDITDFVAKCHNCQQVKVEDQEPGCMTQEINIPTWKWEVLNMDFIAVLPHSAEDYAKIYINEIVRLNGVPLSIISDRGPPFTTYLWKSFQKGLGTQVNLSTTFDPSKDDIRRRDLEFQIDDWVFLKVSPTKGVMILGKKGKLSPRYVRKLRNKEVASVKVLWRSQSIYGATWEAEAAMKAKYPHLFSSNSIPV